LEEKPKRRRRKNEILISLTSLTPIKIIIIKIQNYVYKMDEEYDVVICGTGLVESILSGCLSQSKRKVLHLDKNSYYGGEGASLNLTKLWKMFRPGKEVPSRYGHNRDWNIDLIPKFVLADG
jgi:RAB protein geranylgeranyltransferase component A